MIKQRSVHLKLDNISYAWLENEVFQSGYNRNRLINIAVNTYIRLSQARRRHEDAGKLQEYIEHAKALNIW